MLTPLSPPQLRRTVSPESLGLTTTLELPSLDGLLGQDRAVSALRFGLDIDGFGFNVFVSGPPGIGKMTAIRQFLEELARKRPTAHDWCYRASFDDPSQPLYLRMPPGRGRALQRDLELVIGQVRREIPRAFETESYADKRRESLRALDTERQRILEALGERAKAADLGLSMTPMGIAIVPVRAGEVLPQEEYQALPPEVRAGYESRREVLAGELRVAMKEVRELERTARERLEALDRELASFVVSGLLEDLGERYKDQDGIDTYLHAMHEDILDHLALFRRPTNAEDGGGDADESGVPPGLRALALGGLGKGQNHAHSFLDRYALNVLVDRSRDAGAPVVVELNPTYHNLFGRVEKETQAGSVRTDFTMVKPGSLHQANGGYLVLDIEGLLHDPFCWDALKRALRTREIDIEDVTERLGLSTTRSLRPQPIPLDVKVVLVGPPMHFALLHAYDGSFRELFKVEAEFGTTMAWSDENVRGLLSFVAGLCRREKLRHFDAGAAAAFVEHACRLASDQTRLATHFGALVDVVRAASYWAGQAGAEQVGALHLRQALEHAEYRSNLIEERMREMIQRGTLLIDLKGEKVGQVNGLAVWSLGDYAFGRPTRITASVSPGGGGIIDIEREVALSGPIHSKGVLILSGYLRQIFAQLRPLALTAQLVFEQSYEGVEGDSASSAELYALLSALSGVPLKQSVAVTGSVNQRGEVQAIGGVNEKVEGFFHICKAAGLTGEHGVIIPRSNVDHLMLKEEVLQAVREGQFHVWAVGDISEGLEILCGKPAGVRGPKGRFPKGSVNALVEARLDAFTDSLSDGGSPPGAIFVTTTESPRRKRPARKAASGKPGGKTSAKKAAARTPRGKPKSVAKKPRRG